MLTPLTFDIILCALVVEAGLLVTWVRRAQMKALTAPALLFLLSGAALMLAVRTAVGGQPDEKTAALLFVGGVLHVACLWTLKRFLMGR